MKMTCAVCIFRERMGEDDSSYCIHPDVPYSKEDIDLFGELDAPFWCPLLKEGE